MGKDENLRKLDGNTMKPMNYTLILHWNRYEFETEPVRMDGQRKKEDKKGQRRDRSDLFFALFLKPNE